MVPIGRGFFKEGEEMTRKLSNKPVSEVRVLLSQCFRPWGIDDEYNTTLLTYEGANFSFTDGIWSPRGVCNEVATHFIANNIPVYTMVLDNPSLEEFRDECRKGYDIIGVSSMTMTIKKAKKMMETAKEACPSAVTMVGGYVTVTPGVEEIGADYVCREEGANFIRRFLGLPPVDRYRNPPGLADHRTHDSMRVSQNDQELGPPRPRAVRSGYQEPLAQHRLAQHPLVQRPLAPSHWVGRTLVTVAAREAARP